MTKKLFLNISGVFSPASTTKLELELFETKSNRVFIKKNYTVQKICTVSHLYSFSAHLRKLSINANTKNPIAMKRPSTNGIQNGQRTHTQDQCATGSIASNFSTRNTMPTTVKQPIPPVPVCLFIL